VWRKERKERKRDWERKKKEGAKNTVKEEK